MSFSKLAFLVLLLPLVACVKQVDPKTLTEATIPSYTPPKAVTADTATIKGTYTRSTGLLGTPESITFLVAIDGKFYDVREDQFPNPVPAGKHMIAIGFASGGGSSQLPAYVDFKPGASYVIKYEESDASLNAFNSGGGRGDTLWIEDEKTGEIVAPKLSTLVYDSDNRYVPPSGTTSTISGSTNKQLLDGIDVFVQMVDGFIVDGDGRASILDGEHGRPDYAVPLTPGRHGIAIRMAYNDRYSTFPVMFDVKPNTPYVVKFEEPVQKLYQRRSSVVIPIWIEESATGAVALPKIDLPIFVGKKFTPEQLGLPSTPPATPK